MISGAKSATPYNDIVLRTGAWGKDIVVPTVIAGALTAGIAAAPVAGIEAYRAHSFEKKFWEFITNLSRYRRREGNYVYYGNSDAVSLC